jgi:hypothetical protein
MEYPSESWREFLSEPRLELKSEFLLESRLELKLEFPSESRSELKLEFPSESRLEPELEFLLEPRLELRLEFLLESRLEPELEFRLEFPLELLLESRLEPPPQSGGRGGQRGFQIADCRLQIEEIRTLSTELQIDDRRLEIVPHRRRGNPESGCGLPFGIDPFVPLKSDPPDGF